MNAVATANTTVAAPSMMKSHLIVRLARALREIYPGVVIPPACYGVIGKSSSDSGSEKTTESTRQHRTAKEYSQSHSKFTFSIPSGEQERNTNKERRLAGSHQQFYAYRIRSNNFNSFKLTSAIPKKNLQAAML